jgi:2-dehydro-3-deoxyglucarate aldolase
MTTSSSGPAPVPYRGLPNGFRADLIAGKRLIGCWCSLGSPVSTEVLGIAGFDWILLDAEHAPNDVINLVPQLMSLKDSVSAPVVRPSWNNTVEIKRLLDAGVHNLLVPFVQSAEEARQAVAATRYPPQGVRGVSISQRGNRYGALTQYFREANDHITVMVQIESRAGVEATAEIAAVEGIDGIFVGPQDLAAGYGHLHNPGHPDVQAAIRRVFDDARAAGKPSGILAPVEADARRYLEWGATFVAVGSDLGVLRGGTQALCDKYREGDVTPLAPQY